MKCQSKIDISMTNPFGGVDHILIMGKIYECEFAPTIYSVIGFQPDKPSYIVKCEDGKFRRYEVDYFIGIHELREQKLNELGI